MLADRLGALDLHEVHRFAEQWEKDASLRLRQGDVTAVADYQVRGRIHAAPRDQARRNMVLDWTGSVRAGRDALMIAQTEAEVAELNRQAAAHLARAREAAGWRPGPERVRLSDGNYAQTGDWIQARLNDHLIGAAGQWLANRDILQITRIYGHGPDRQIEARRRLPDGTWTAEFTIPARYAEQSATLGYATTVYAAQGRTVDVAHALITAGMNREALYVAATRGRQENRLHVVTGPDRAQQQADPETILGQALATPASEQSATAELDVAMDENDHPARLLYLYQEITAAERGTHLDEEFRTRLDPASFARYLSDPVRPMLHRAIRELQLAGHDTAAVLDQITSASMDRARSIASVLHGRLQHLKLPDRQPAATWAQRLPEARIPGPARQAAQMMDARTQTIGEQLAARPEPWLVDRLGMPPQQPGALRDDWISRAGRAGFYRRAHGITYPNAALGELPANNPELRMLWEQTHQDLEIPADEAHFRAKPRAELERTVHAYTRAAETAPPDISRQLNHHRRQAAVLERQAEQAEADGDARLASDSRAAAADENRQASELSSAQDARDAWDQAHEAKRLAARAARQELDRRGIQVVPGHRETESLTEWWRQFDARAEAASRAIGRQRQAAIDAGEPWPTRPGRIDGPSSPGAHKVFQPEPDEYLPGLKLAEYEQEAEIPGSGQLQAELELKAEPGPNADLGERIGASIRLVQDAGQRIAADLEAGQQERSAYAARIAQEALSRLLTGSAAGPDGRAG